MNLKAKVPRSQQLIPRRYIPLHKKKTPFSRSLARVKKDTTGTHLMNSTNDHGDVM